MNFPGGFNINDPTFQNTWAFFQQQMILQQQQQQQFQQNLFMQYQNFCQTRGLNPNDQNSLNLFYQQNQPNIPVENTGSNQQNDNDNYINTNIKKTDDKEIKPSKIDPNEPKYLIPRGEKTLYLNEMGGDKLILGNQNPNIINITFSTSTGLRIIISTPNNITINQLLKKYMDRLGLPMEHIDKDLTFLFNGGRIDPFSNELLSVNFKNNMCITVFDKAGVIGA